MRYCTIILLFCYIFTACSDSTTPDTEMPASKNWEELIAEDTLPFPQSWLGNWEGELNIYQNNKVVQTLPMALEMAAIDTSDSFVWAIIYGEDKEAGRRAYFLNPVDPAKGHYVVDEDNSIFLETYLFNNKLYSWYLVAGNMILSVYEKIGDQMIFEIVAGSNTPVSITGDTLYNGEEIPKVETFPVRTIQRGILRRQ